MAFSLPVGSVVKPPQRFIFAAARLEQVPPKRGQGLGQDRSRPGQRIAARRRLRYARARYLFRTHRHTMNTDTQARKTKTPVKLTRQQIKEGLEQFPVEVLLSAGKGKKAQLTHKQKEFARQLALGKTKAQAYRESYTQTPAPTTITQEPYRLAADPRIAAEVEAYKLAIEAEKHRTPAQLKSLLVQQLVQHSLDPEFPPAQRVQCLKLLGSLFEVGAFVERKEITTIKRSGEIKARLIETLKDVTDVIDADAGLDLLAELAQDRALAENSPPLAVEVSQPDPTTGAPAAIDASAGGDATHSVPLKESQQKSDDVQEMDVTREDPPMELEQKEGGGV